MQWVKFKRFSLLAAVFALALFLAAPDLWAGAIEGRASRDLPQGTPDTNVIGVRTSRFGDMMTVPLHGKKQALADEGSYYISTNPTPGTPIAATTSITTYADTAGAVGNYFYWRNTDVNGGKRVYMDYLKLMIVQVPTNATSWQWALVTDYGTARYTSGGSAITPVPPNGDVGRPSILQMYAGAVTTAVGVSKRIVGRGTFRGVIPTTFDTFILVFGGTGGGGTMASAAASGRVVDVTSPVILGPGQNLTMLMWGAANAAAPSFEFEVGHWEK